MRLKERQDANQNLVKEREVGETRAEQVKREMEERLEKQVKMIEALLEDKKDLSAKVDQLIDQIKDTER